MLERIIMAGFGGQGIMFLGKLLCQAYMQEGKHVTFIPSYGAEMRGGTANCHVVISDDEIGSPLVEKATIVVAMNQPSYEKFKGRLGKDGLLLVNSSLIRADSPPERVQVFKVPATEIASEIGDVRVANMVVLGALIAIRQLLPSEKFISILPTFYSGKSRTVIALNSEAIHRGVEYARSMIL